MSDEYVSEAIVRWDDDGQVKVMWDCNGHVYGFSIAPEMFDQMHLNVASFDEVRDQTPVVLQLLVWDDVESAGFQHEVEDDS